MYCVWQVVKTLAIICNNPVFFYNRVGLVHVTLTALDTKIKSILLFSLYFHVLLNSRCSCIDTVAAHTSFIWPSFMFH